MRERRSQIAEALLFHDPVARKDIPLLTPQLTEVYAQAGPKTLARDLNELENVGLIRCESGLYKAREEVLGSRLPVRV